LEIFANACGGLANLCAATARGSKRLERAPLLRHVSLMRILTTALATLIAFPLAAAEPMSAEEFEAYTTGKTLFFGQNGQAYGAEEYLQNRRVRWSFLDGECKEGRWYSAGEQICFVYEDNPDPQCWIFTQGPSGLIAEFIGDDTLPELYEAQDLGEEMLCLGPEVGV